MKILGMEMDELSQQLQNRIRGNYERIQDERMFKMLIEMLAEKGILTLEDLKRMDTERLKVVAERDLMCKKAHLSFTDEMSRMEKEEHEHKEEESTVAENKSESKLASQSKTENKNQEKFDKLI